MRIYLAGKPTEHELFNDYAAKFRSHGCEVVSRWHDSDEIANILARFQTMRDQQDEFVMKFLRITLGQNIAGEEITDTDRKTVAGGPTAFEVEHAFRQFKSALRKADCVVADLNGASMETGFALALGKRVVVIGDSGSPLIPCCIDKIKVANDWVEALAIVLNLSGAQRVGRKLALVARKELR